MQQVFRADLVVHIEIMFEYILVNFPMMWYNIWNKIPD